MTDKKRKQRKGHQNSAISVKQDNPSNKAQGRLGVALFSLVAMVTVVMVLAVNGLSVAVAGEKVVVYKSPSCGCCGKWVDHLKANGFEVEVHDRQNMSPIKQSMGIAPKLQSCHTAKVGDYVIEGHVPAEDIKRMIADKPDIKGLTVPGMPMGSPGMEGPYKDNYSVMAIQKDGATQVYRRH